VDWMAHLAFVFILCTLLALKWPVFGGRNTVLAMVGAVLPDLFKLYLALPLIFTDYLAPFHIPIGTLLMCGLGALLFEEGTRTRVFLLFTFGMATHYALDALLKHVTGGIMFLYPLSWETWQLQLVRPDNWLRTSIMVAAAVLVYGLLKVRSDRRVGRAERATEETSGNV